jgi:hypothetical protein
VDGQTNAFDEAVGLDLPISSAVASLAQSESQIKERRPVKYALCTLRCLDGNKLS